jgi:hypothetical protein
MGFPRSGITSFAPPRGGSAPTRNSTKCYINRRFGPTHLRYPSAVRERGRVVCRGRRGRAGPGLSVCRAVKSLGALGQCLRMDASGLPIVDVLSTSTVPFAHAISSRSATVM